MNKKLIAKIIGAMLLTNQITVVAMPTTEVGAVSKSETNQRFYAPNINQSEVKKSTQIGVVVESGEAVNVFSELERDEELMKAYLEQYAVKPLSVEDPSWMTGVTGSFPGAPDIDEFPSANALIDGDVNTFWKSFYWPREEDGIYDSEARVAFEFKLEDVGDINSIILRGQDGYESESPLKIEIYESDGPSVYDGEMIKVCSIENKQGIANSYIEIPLTREITKPYIHVRITGVDGGSHARFTEIGFLKEDTLREGAAKLFTDSMFAELSSEYSTYESIDSLENQLDGHILEETYRSSIEVAKALINNEERPDRYAMELEATGDLVRYKDEMQLSMRISEAQPIGYYATAGETIEVYVEAGPNGELPKIGFGQVGEVDNETYTAMSYYEKVMEAIGTGQEANLIQLKAGYNQVQLPNQPFGEGRYGRLEPYAIYFTYAGSEGISGGAKVRVSGESLSPYPVYRYGIDSIDNYKEELLNHTGANMTHFITERFQLSTTKTVMLNVLNNPIYDNDENVEKLDTHAEAIFKFAGIDEEDIRGRLHLAGSNTLPPAGAAAFAGQGVVHMPYNWATNIMLSDYQDVYSHEFFHQLANKYLNVWESPQVLSENFIKIMLGIDVYTKESLLIDTYINYLGTKGMSQFDGDGLINQNLDYTIGRYNQDPIFAIPFIYFGEDNYGIDIYGEATKLLRSGNHDIPLDSPKGEIVAVDRGNVGQNWLMTFSIVTGYDLRPYFEYFKAPINEITNNYLDQKIAEGTIKELDGKIEKLHLVTPKTTIARQEKLPVFTSNTRVSLDISRSSSQIVLNMNVNDSEKSVLAYEIYKKTNDGEYEFWGISRNSEFKISQILDTENPRYIDLSEENSHEFYAIAYDYELNATNPSNMLPSNEAPVLNGVENKTITVGTSFDPMEGITAEDAEDGNLTEAIKIEGTVDTDTAGEYQLTYTVVDSDGEETRALRTITVVVDKTALQAEVEAGESLNSEDYTEVTYKAFEAALSEAKLVLANENVTQEEINNALYVLIEAKKTLKLLGEKPVINAVDVILEIGEKFNPLDNVTATDKEDGDVTSEIEVVNNTVDTTKAGDYEVTYKVIDSDNNETIITINVSVVNNNAIHNIIAKEEVNQFEENQFDLSLGNNVDQVRVRYIWDENGIQKEYYEYYLVEESGKLVINRALKFAKNYRIEFTPIIKGKIQEKETKSIDLKVVEYKEELIKSITGNNEVNSTTIDKVGDAVVFKIETSLNVEKIRFTFTTSNNYTEQYSRQSNAKEVDGKLVWTIVRPLRTAVDTHKLIISAINGNVAVDSHNYQINIGR